MDADILYIIIVTILFAIVYAFAGPECGSIKTVLMNADILYCCTITTVLAIVFATLYFIGEHP